MLRLFCYFLFIVDMGFCNNISTHVFYNGSGHIDACTSACFSLLACKLLKDVCIYIDKWNGL